MVPLPGVARRRRGAPSLGPVEQVAAFTRYVGLVVAVFAALLVAPAATTAAWAFARRGFRRAATDEFTPVEIREGVRASGRPAGPTARRGHLQHFRGEDPLDVVE